MTKPVARLNPIRQQVLLALITTQGTTRSHKVWDAKAADVATTQVPIVAAPVGLAANVSERNVNILAARWAR